MLHIGYHRLNNIIIIYYHTPKIENDLFAMIPGFSNNA